ICVVASITVFAYGLIARLWQRPFRWFSVPLILLALSGTSTVLLLPRLQTPIIGLVWSFVTTGILSVIFYLNLLPRLRLARTILLLAMRLVALALLILMFFEPTFSYSYKPKPDRPLFFL